MAISPINTGVKKGSSGLGTIGAVVGALGAAATTIATAGAAAPVTIPAIVGAAGTGSALGSIGGSVIKPGSPDEKLPSVDTSAMQRRLDQSRAPAPNVDLSESSSILKDSLMALRNAPPQIQQAYHPVLGRALVKSIASDYDSYRGV